MYTCMHKLIVCKLFSLEDYLVSYASHVKVLIWGFCLTYCVMCTRVHIYAGVCGQDNFIQLVFFLLYMGARVELTLGLPCRSLYLLSHLPPQLCGFKGEV